MQPLTNANHAYRLKSFAVFGFGLFVILYRFYSSTMLSELANPIVPELVFPSIDNSYWLLLLSGVPQFLLSHSYLITFVDLLLFVLPLAAMFSDKKQGLAIAFTIFYTLYFFIFNTYSGHHYHGLFGLLIISIPFWTNKPERFNLLWRAVRYYLLFLFVSGACWKLFRGAAFDPMHMHNILLQQHGQLLAEQPGSFYAQGIRWLLNHPTVSYSMFLATTIIEFSFIIGFFTARFDRVLLVLFLLFCITNFLVMHIVSAELLVLGATLVDWDRIAARQERLQAGKPVAQQVVG